MKLRSLAATIKAALIERGITDILHESTASSREVRSARLARGVVLVCLLAFAQCAGQAGVPGSMQQWNRPFPACSGPS